MPDQVTRIPLSGSSDGSPIHLTGTTSGAAHAVHTGPTVGYDWVEVYANNQHTGAVIVSFELGGTGITKQLDVSVTNDTAMTDPILRLYMFGSLTLEAFCPTTAVVNLVGSAQRYS